MGAEIMRLKICVAAASAAILTLAATPSFAQPNATVDPWAGLYVGIGGNAGEIFGGNKLSFQDLSAAKDLSFVSSGTSNSEFAGGAQLSQLWNVGGAYLGIESDISFAKNFKYLSSFRAVLGAPVGPFLFYGTGGVGMSVTHEEFTVNSATGETDNFQGDDRRYGWAAGAGIQALVTPHLSIGVEGVYYGLGHETTPLATALEGEPFNLIADRNFTIVRARIDYRFTSIF
jgi:outer membrane immunogenic protein